MTTEKKRVLIIAYGEIALKKGKRHIFEKKLLENLKAKLKGHHCKSFHLIRGRIKIALHPEADIHTVSQLASSTFGVVSVQPAESIDTDWDKIVEQVQEKIKLHPLKSIEKSFCIRVNRPFKQFPMKSEEIGRKLGGIVLEECTSWNVDLTNPEVEIIIEIHAAETFIGTQKIRGPGGLPVGCSGKLALLLSGGIDSPVAAHLMQKRGAKLMGIYFHSHPYTGDQALNKVIDLAKIIRSNQNEFPLFKVHLTQIQEAIRDNCDPKYAVILARRMMMRLGSFYASRKKAKGLVTGESLGQVASQTLDNMQVISSEATMPIYRPLIGMDKVEIMDLARKIGTYDISIRPYEDCCSLFVDPNPITNAKFDLVKEQEAKINWEELFQDAISKSGRIEY